MRVTLFIPCLVDTFFPQAGEAVVRILHRLGHQTLFPPDQTCCGQPAYNAGHHRQARRVARHFIEVFENATTVVCPSGSCVHMVRHHYPQLFADQPTWRRRANAVAQKVFEFCEFLVDHLHVEQLGARYYGRVTYHESCHLGSGLGVVNAPRQLLNAVDGIDLAEMDAADRCCGFGGAFSIHYPKISTAMVDEKIQAILATGAQTVVGADAGCLLNIEGRMRRRGLPVTVAHIAEMLDGDTLYRNRLAP